MNLEDRLRAAVRSEAAAVDPDEEQGLTQIHSRVHAARHRRRVMAGAGLAFVLLVAGLLIVPNLGDDSAQVDVIDEPTTATTTVTTAPTPTTTAPTSTTVPAAPNPQIVWPGPDHEGYTDPVDAVRSFVVEYLGFPDPPLSEFRQGEPGAGEVDVFAINEKGEPFGPVASTVFVRRFDGDDWFVTGAASDDIVIDTPQPLAVVDAPVVVDGRGRGYEATIILDIHEAFTREPLVGETTFGGCCEELVPFHAEIPLFGIEPATPAGVLVATNSSGLEVAITAFTVVPIQFASASTPVTAYFYGASGLVANTAAVPSTPGVLRASLEVLFMGPPAGLTTAVPAGTTLADVSITDGVAEVDLARPGTAPGAPASSGDRAVEQLNATVFQFENVERVHYQLNGSCEDFDSWLGQGCEFDRP